MSNYTASTSTIESDNSNAIFIHPPHSKQSENPSADTDRGTFSQVPHSFPNNINNVERETIKHDIETVSKTALQKKYPSEYGSFHNMRYQRCGPKGGYICHPSINTFPKFLLAFGPKPVADWSIDRIDPNDVEYAPDKCEWVSKQRQAENRRNVKRYTHSNGDSFIIPEWSRRRIDLPAKTIYRRLNELGWSVDDAVDTPVHGKRKKSAASPSATDCKSSGSKATSGLSYVEFCDKNETYYDIQYIPPRIAPMLDLLKRVLVEHYETPFFAVEIKHLKMLRDIADILEQSLDRNKVFACVVNDWGDEYGGFTHYACQRGSFNPPNIPTIEFIRGNINAAGNFYLREQGLLQHYAAGMPQPGLEEKYREDMSAEHIEYNLKQNFPERFEDNNSFMSPDEWHMLQHTI